MNKMKDLKEVSSEDLRQELELRGWYIQTPTADKIVIAMSKNDFFTDPSTLIVSPARPVEIFSNVFSLNAIFDIIIF